jgi:HEAT repeat protein
MATFEEQVAELIAQLDGSAGFGALRNLNSLGPRAIPLVAAAYPRELIGTRRAALIEALWQFRDPVVMPTLANALLDADALVWKEALNGVVTLGGSSALEVLQVARDAVGRHVDADLRIEWTDEAVEQVRAARAWPVRCAPSWRDPRTDTTR